MSPTWFCIYNEIMPRTKLGSFSGLLHHTCNICCDDNVLNENAVSVQVTPDRRDLREALDHKETLEQQAFREELGPLDLEGSEDSKVFEASLDHRDLPDSQDSWVELAALVLLALLGHQVQKQPVGTRYLVL